MPLQSVPEKIFRDTYSVPFYGWKFRRKTVCRCEEHFSLYPSGNTHLCVLHDIYFLHAPPLMVTNCIFLSPQNLPIVKHVCVLQYIIIFRKHEQLEKRVQILSRWSESLGYYMQGHCVEHITASRLWSNNHAFQQFACCCCRCCC